MKIEVRVEDDDKRSEWYKVYLVWIFGKLHKVCLV